MISRLKKVGRDFSLLLSAHTTQDKAIPATGYGMRILVLFG